MNKADKRLLCEALEIAHRAWKRSELARGGCQPDNESEQRSIDAGLRAKHAERLFAQLGGTTEEYVRRVVTGGLESREYMR